MTKRNRNQLHIRPRALNEIDNTQTPIVSNTPDAVIEEEVVVDETTIVLNLDDFIAGDDPSIVRTDLSYIGDPEPPVVIPKNEGEEEVVDNVLNYTDGREIRRRGAIDRLERMARVFSKKR